MSPCFRKCRKQESTGQNSFPMILPFSCDPSECDGYPSPMFFKEKPAHEFHFLLECGDVEEETKTLACSVIPTMDNAQTPVGDSIQDKLALLDRSKPFIIICHGMLSWRNQWLLANLASQLTTELSCHTLRFDFTGCGHSSGPWTYADYETDFLDLEQVKNFITSSLECRVGCIIGHSQGSAAIIRHAHKYDKFDTDSRPLYVNLAGRCFAPNSFDPKTKFKASQYKELESKGRFIMMKRGSRIFEISMDAIRKRNLYDVQEFAKGISSSQILTIHGDQDKMVPVENAYKFGELCEHHQLCIIDGGDHNFSGMKRVDEIVLTVSSFVRRHPQT